MGLGSRRPARRVRRHLALRSFAQRHDWSVVGMVTDLSARYVALGDLAASPSARAELAVQGDWLGWPATVALVAVRPPSRTGRRPVDEVVLLVLLDTGPLSTQLAAEVTAGPADVALLGRRAPPEGVVRLLSSGPSGAGARRLRPGDRVVLGDVDVLLARRLGRSDDMPDPADLLDVLVELLAATDERTDGGDEPM